MTTFLDSFAGKVGGGDHPQDNHGTTPPEEGNSKDTEGDEFEQTDILDLHRGFLRAFGFQPIGKLKQGVHTEVVGDCLRQSYNKKGWGSKKVDFGILGTPSDDDLGEFQTVLHLIPNALKSSWDNVGEGPDRDTRTESFAGLFRWLMANYTSLYLLKGDSGSDFLQVAINTATPRASPAQSKRSAAAINAVKNKIDAAREVLKVFICEFPVQAAELLQVGPASQDREHARKVHNLLSLVEGFGKIEPLFEAFDSNTILVTDDDGDTVLHRAAKYGISPGLPPAERALRIVRCLVKTCPDALKVLNSKGLSPYQTRVEKLVETGDELTRFLKTQYIRCPPEEATELLYGGARGHELCLNLEHLRGERLPEKQLVSMLERLNLDTHLIFVRLPSFVVIPDESQRLGEQEQLGSGRADFSIIFRVLKNDIGVKKILKIEVEDIEQPSHRDDIIIDCLKDFGIEEWDWRKLDLCTEVIREAAKDVRQIRLYSSGNNAVLRGWSGEDGLKSFEKLENVHVTFSEVRAPPSYLRTEIGTIAYLDAGTKGLVSENTLKKYGKNFEGRIDEACKKEPQKKLDIRLTYPDWGSSAANSQGGISAGAGGYDRTAENQWIRDMRRISKFVHTVLRKDAKKREVKVAIIDDGIGLYNFEPGSRSKDIHGRSFESDPTGSPWYSSPGKHGTLMAKLVRLVCPGSTLYIARLRLTSSHPSGGSPQFQPTASSAAKAINWAVSQDVDIISMSWTIEPPGDTEAQELGDAISKAHDKKILLFGTTYNENTYPINKHRDITCIGGANIHGDQIPESRKGNPKFTFPSSDLGREFQQDASAVGSSISTALAAGLAALIIYCAEYTGLCESREALRRGVTQMFQAMGSGNTEPVYVDPKLFFDPNDPNNRHAEAEGFELIRGAIENLKKKAQL